MNEQPSGQNAYEELQAYTLGLRDPGFRHQHVVDAWTAQHANAHTKPIALTFALIGLRLHVERGWSGKQVQRAHMALAQKKRAWPSWPLPPDRGAFTAATVMKAPPGQRRDRAVDAWCESVWSAFREVQPAVRELLAQHDGAG